MVGGKTAKIGDGSQASSTLVLKDDDGVFDIATTAGTLRIYDDNNERLRMDSTGAVTIPSQPCFSVKKGSAQNNITAGGAAQTITFDTELFDQGSDFASNTFTAPITGRYKIQYTITVVQMDLDASEMNFRLASSNRNYSNTLSPTPFDADSGNFPIVGTYMVDMDANDTVFLQLVYDGGSQLDVAADSYFSGFLVA